MPSTATSIWLALKARVETLALTPALPVAWPRSQFGAPQSGSSAKPGPYLEVRHLPNANVDHGVADNATYEGQGILQITLKYPVGDKTLKPGYEETTQAEIVGQIAAHFPKGTKMSHGGVVLKVERQPDIGAPFLDERDPYWQTPISVRYFTFI